MMARRDDEPQVVRPSVLDRLIDDEPGLSADSQPGWEESLDRHRAAVIRDLEWLLNTRRSPDPGPLDDFPELRRSLMAFGPPDVSSLSGDTAKTRRRLLRQLEELIRIFEPRLVGARVRLDEGEAKGSRQIRFVVEGMLRLESDEERVVFDTVLEVSSGRFVIGGAGNA